MDTHEINFIFVLYIKVTALVVVIIIDFMLLLGMELGIKNLTPAVQFRRPSSTKCSKRPVTLEMLENRLLVGNRNCN